MSQELEIEFKNLLEENEYHRLLSAFSIDDEKKVIQENFYFDTAQFSLKNQGAALRIREKNGTYTLTLKQPVPRGLLETHQVLTGEEAKQMLDGGPIIDGEVSTILKTLSINPMDVTFYGSLKTKRAEVEYKKGLLVLDKSYYLNRCDFEVEYEVTDEVIGKEIFNELLLQHNIPIRKTDNKIRRFYDRKKQILLGEEHS
ncbi:CYTH domain-containing protein [Fredinandcohnia sp. QZ13]|uniref:CYTH domain-containing protein n=1 Tax=Fredinandcohnia sp. QZ13 TaxID=3073144 RepID=UPI00285311BB|nr:CYTH domain-containing protein [Fredinandcohnia sp. QZ13]MDR4887002.1 CYTH domain-containing protein [Fredinandcohnia sp. QZ13]